jgi:hypothetical protein
MYLVARKFDGKSPMEITGKCVSDLAIVAFPNASMVKSLA